MQRSAAVSHPRTPTPTVRPHSNVILPPTIGRRENLATSSAQLDPVVPATPSDPPLAFGSRRMTASVVQRDFAPENPLAADRSEQRLSPRPTALSAVNPYVTPCSRPPGLRWDTTHSL